MKAKTLVFVVSLLFFVLPLTNAQSTEESTSNKDTNTEVHLLMQETIFSGAKDLYIIFYALTGVCDSIAILLCYTVVGIPLSLILFATGDIFAHLALCFGNPAVPTIISWVYYRITQPFRSLWHRLLEEYGEST
jgi:hypothetical protein